MREIRLGSIFKVLHEVLGREGENPLSDAQLLERFATSRDEMAFEVLVHRHSRTVWNACRRVLSREHDIEDAYQATFLILARKAGSVAWKKSVAGWLRRVARWVALRAKNKAKNLATREQQHAVAEAIEESTPACVWQEVRLVLDEEIERLPYKLRLPFVLCQVEGKTNAEAGQELGCTEGAIATRLVRARQKLAKQLSRRGVTLPAGLGVAVVLDKAMATASVPSQSISVTVRAGLAYATDGMRARGVSVEAATLAEGFVRTTLMSKVGVGIGIVMFFGLLACGTELVVGRKSATPTEVTKTERVSSSVVTDRRKGIPQMEAPPKKRTDLGGDVLPAGALARLGTARFRCEDGLSTLAYTQDGKVLATGGQGTASLWDVATGKELHRMKVTHGVVAFAPDGKSLVEEGFRTLSIRDIPSGKLRWQKKTEEWVSVVYAPNSEILAIGSTPNRPIQLWDVASGKLLGETADRFSCSALTFAPDGKTLACVWYDSNDKQNKVRAWTISSGKQLWQREAGQSNCVMRGLAYAPNGRTLAVGSEGIQLWDADTGKEIRRMDASHGFGRDRIAFAPDGSTLASECTDDDMNMVRLWDPSSGKLLWQKNGILGCRLSDTWRGGSSLSYAPDSRTLAAGSSEDGIVHLLETATGKEISPSRGHEAPIFAVTYAQDGKTVLTAGGDETVRQWDIASGRQLAQTQISGEKGENDGNRGAFRMYTFSPDHKTIVKTIATRGHGHVELWDSDGQQLWRKGYDNSHVVSAYAPDSKTLAIQGVEEVDCVETRLLETASGKELWRIKLQGFMCNAFSSICPDVRPELMFSPDNMTLIVTIPRFSGEELRTTLVMLDAAAGRELRRIHYDGGCVRGLTYTLDGKVLAAIVNDNQETQVCLWEVITGQKISQFRLFPKSQEEENFSQDPECLEALAFAPDGRMLACEGNKGSVWLWDLATGRESRRFRHPRQEQICPRSIQVLAYAPNGRSLVSANVDGTALIWNLAELNTQTQPAKGKPNADQLTRLWNELADTDAERADRALWALSEVPIETVSFLRSKLLPVAPRPAPPDPARLRRLLSNLDANTYADREQAAQEIKSLGEPVIPALRQALTDNPSLESRQRIETLLTVLTDLQKPNPLPNLSTEALQKYRALRLLERAGTAEARQILKELAAGALGAVQTREAEAALGRLAARDFSP